MKINDYREIEKYLDEAKENLMNVYQNYDTSESEWFSKELDEIIKKLEEIRQSQIFEFRIED